MYKVRLVFIYLSFIILIVMCIVDEIRIQTYYSGIAIILSRMKTPGSF